MQKSRTDLLLEAIGEARLFEEWEAAAFALDECLDFDMWYVFPSHLLSNACCSSSHTDTFTY